MTTTKRRRNTPTSEQGKKKEKEKRDDQNKKSSLKLRFLALFVSDFLATSTLFSHSYLHIKHATAATFQKWQEFYILWILMIFAAMLCYLSSSEIKNTKFRPGRNSNPLRRRFSYQANCSWELVVMWFIYNPPKNFCGFLLNKTDLGIRNRAMDISQLLFNFHTLYEFRFSDWLICTTWPWVMTQQPPWRHYHGVIALVLYTTVITPWLWLTQNLTIFACSVFNLNNKKVNALIARELSGFICTRSLTMNSKFFNTALGGLVRYWNFSFIVSELVQVNPDN